MALLRWVSRKCPHLKYILKTDDDVIVNIELLNRTLHQFKPGYTGHSAREMVNRDTTFKQHIPKQYYPNKYIPEYVYGPAYLLTTDMIDKLLDTIDSYTDYVLDIDDVFITGIIAEKAGVARHWDSRLEFGQNCQINDNNLYRMCSLIALVQCNNSTEIIDFYREWQFNFRCPLSSGETTLSSGETTSLSLLMVLSILFIIILFIV